jgi:hypothetical protein
MTYERPTATNACRAERRAGKRAGKSKISDPPIVHLNNTVPHHRITPQPRPMRHDKCSDYTFYNSIYAQISLEALSPNSSLMVKLGPVLTL